MTIECLGEVNAFVVGLQNKHRLTKRAPDAGDSAHFRALSTPEQNPALGVLSPPAHPQVTQAVGRLNKWM